MMNAGASNSKTEKLVVRDHKVMQYWADSKNALRGTVATFNGHVRVGIGKYWFSPRLNQWFPAKKGHLYQSPEQWRAFAQRVSGLTQAMNALEKKQQISGEIASAGTHSHWIYYVQYMSVHIARFVRIDQFGVWSDSGESDNEDGDGECARTGHGVAGAGVANSANVLPSDAVDGHATAGVPTAGKKRGRKPRKTADEGTAGEEKAKRSKQVSQQGASKPEERAKGSCVDLDGSDNATIL
jgi:hypothetical protein